MRIVQIRNREELDREIAKYELDNRYGKCTLYTGSGDETEIKIDSVKYPFIGAFRWEYWSGRNGRIDGETLHIGVITKIDVALLLTNT